MVPVPSTARFLTTVPRSEEHTSELQSRPHLVCRLLLEKKKQARFQHPRLLHYPRAADLVIGSFRVPRLIWPNACWPSITVKDDRVDGGKTVSADRAPQV